MIWPDKPFYVISGFVPPSKGETRMGMWGFSAGLNLDLAKKAFSEEITDKAYERFTKRGEELVKSLGLAGEDHGIYPPYSFVRNKEDKLTFLLQYLQVPGNATQLGTDWQSIEGLDGEHSYEKLFEYHPHNVDNIYQAGGLLSLWINWAEGIYATFRDKGEE